jgi:hypothetical protein
MQYFTVSVHLNIDLIRRVAVGGSCLIRGRLMYQIGENLEEVQDLVVQTSIKFN